MIPGLVSVMMPAYNAASYIGQAIESVLAQRFADWELVIVNDGSTDDTAAVVARYHDPRIRLIHQPNGGEAAARNTALEHMRGEFVAFLDADDMWLPNHLQAAMHYLQTHPDFGGVYTDGYHIDQQGNRLLPLSSRRRGFHSGNVFQEAIRASDLFGPPLCVLIRRHPVLALDLHFDGQIGYGTDWDFFVRYAEVTLFGYIKEMTCLYRVHTSNMTLHLDQQKRRLWWARCREKAINLPSFGQCDEDVRCWVFYDLLVNLLPGHPVRQNAIIQLPEFGQLPAKEQARLLRLMASKASTGPHDQECVQAWLRRARQLAPGDVRVAVSWLLFALSPAVYRAVLRTKQRLYPDTALASPFGKLA